MLRAETFVLVADGAIDCIEAFTDNCVGVLHALVGQSIIYDCLRTCCDIQALQGVFLLIIAPHMPRSHCLRYMVHFHKRIIGGRRKMMQYS